MMNATYRMSTQQIFNPIDYAFSWTDDGWYTWDSKAAVKHARQARDRAVKQLKADGRTVSKFSLPGQLVRRGGIGSGKPDVEFVVTCYGLNAL